jgi:CspA family cold shock protein
MQTGECKWFDSKKGYGFILRENQPDLFVHFSAIKSEGFKTLYQGDKVTYEVVQGDKGEQASDVVVTEKARRQDSRDDLDE